MLLTSELSGLFVKNNYTNGTVTALKNEKVDRAFELYKQGLKPVDIAEKLDISVNTIKTWKRRYSWDNQKEKEEEKPVVHRRKRGGQPGNHNATGPPGNKNALGNKGGPPIGSHNALKHGLYCKKYLPDETLEICNDIMTADPLDLLWNQIILQYAAIVRSQKLMYVKDQSDRTTSKIAEKNGDTVYEERWQVQEAWDKHANYMKALSTAQNTLNGLIKRYDEMLHKNWDLATEEQKTRIEVMKAKSQITEQEEIADDGFLEALNASAAEDWADED